LAQAFDPLTLLANFCITGVAAEQLREALTGLAQLGHQTPHLIAILAADTVNFLPLLWRKVEALFPTLSSRATSLLNSPLGSHLGAGGLGAGNAN
jgi:hypothetical protein